MKLHNKILKFVLPLVISYSSLISCKYSNKRDNYKLSDINNSKSNEIVSKLFFDSITGRLMAKFKTVNDTIVVGQIKEYKYHPNGVLYKDITFDSTWTEIIGYVSEYDSFGSLYKRKSYWYSKGFNRNLLNDYIVYDNDGNINKNKSEYVEIIPDYDTIKGIKKIERKFSVFFANSKIESIDLYFDTILSIKKHYKLLLSTDKYRDVSFSLPSSFFYGLSEFYLTFKIRFFDYDDNKIYTRIIWKRFFVKK